MINTEWLNHVIARYLDKERVRRTTRTTGSCLGSSWKSYSRTVNQTGVWTGALNAQDPLTQYCRSDQENPCKANPAENIVFTEDSALLLPY